MALAVSLRARATGVREALGDRDLARLLGVWGVFVTADWTLLITVSLLALEAAGSAAVGLVGAVRVLPAAVLTGPVSVLSDRWPRSRLLAGLVAGWGLLAALLIWVALADRGLPVLLVATGVGSALGAAVKPTLQAMVPTLVSSPAQLVTAGSAYATVEALGTVVGPGLCAAGLGLAGAPGVLGVLVVLLGVAAVLAASIRSPYQPARRTGDVGAAWLAPLRGFAVLARPALRLPVTLFMGQTAVRGVLNVVVVLVAVSLPGGGEALAGTLFVGMGVGGLVGAVLAMGLGSRRATVWIAVGLVLWGLPVAVLGLVGHAGLAAAALAVVGLGNALLDVSGYSLVNRLVPDHLAGRAWGAFYALSAGVLALGSLVAPPLVDALGLAGATGLAGGLLALSPLLTWPWLRRLGTAAEGRAADVALLRAVPLFAALSLIGVERLAVGARERRVATDEVVVRQGDVADAFFVLADGAASVWRDGEEVRRLGPPDAFGEVALLEPGPRTATVVAQQPSRLLVLDREGFVAAVTGHRPTDDLARRSVAEVRAADQRRRTG